MEDILQAVSTVGFPIAVACYALYMNYRNQAEHNKTILMLNEAHENRIREIEKYHTDKWAEVVEFNTEAINGNTTVLSKLATLIESKL